MRIVSFVLLSSALGCASARHNPELTSGIEKTLDSSQNLVIVLHNEIGRSYELVSATYLLDGKRVFHKASTAGWTELPEELRIYRGYSTPGRHSLIVQLEYRPNDYGIFTYARGYHIKVTSGQEFVTHERKPTAVHAVVTESAGLTASVEERPQVWYYVTTPEEEVATMVGPG
jgi:hypothetical protein